MKKYMIKLITLLVFSSVAVSSCSMEYRQQHRSTGHHDRNRGYDHDRDRDDHRYDRHYNRY